ncbi:MAG: phosphoribosylformylglycinamidine synthase subunit PurS [Proteobacteria bacterium]|nr:phosphoribosylformylglycinamidine synthase subunit PurS [Pseudomonadota bacterium]
MRITITITHKTGVLDPEAQAITTALNNLGYSEVKGVAVGKSITLDVDETDVSRATQKVAKMCETLLVNTIIEDYTISINKTKKTGKRNA